MTESISASAIAVFVSPSVVSPVSICSSDVSTSSSVGAGVAVGVTVVVEPEPVATPPLELPEPVAVEDVLDGAVDEEAVFVVDGWADSGKVAPSLAGDPAIKMMGGSPKIGWS